MEFYEVHTSDRIAYKRCRRKWAFSSPLRYHIIPAQEAENIHLWFGTGIHFALEDFKGYHRFETPMDALEAYYGACTNKPEGAEEYLELGIKMLEHFIRWEKHREKFKTVWIEGVPQVECRFALELSDLSEAAGKPVIYRGTLDRLAIDEEGGYWIEDYKTAKTIDTYKLATDPQINAYIWAAEQYFQIDIQGVIYTQLAKKAPKNPVILSNGTLSVNKNQSTTHHKYREELLKIYPDGDFPVKYVEFLNTLLENETPEGDGFIRRDKVYRNHDVKLSTYNHIIDEVKEMIELKLPLYPNPTRDCAWDCPYRELCILMEEGGDWLYQMENFYIEKPEQDETWRSRIRWPEEKEESNA
jgi:RecB family exonuclease